MKTCEPWERGWRNPPPRLICRDIQFCGLAAFLALHMSCVIVPMGQYTHHDRGLNSIMVINPSTVDVSITL